MIKKLIAIIIGLMAFCSAASVFAAEAWRDAFVSRIINSWLTDSSYTDVVLTDLDENGIPEAFLVKPGTMGEIGIGLTMQNNTIVQISVPHNISGDCLKDITVYTDEENFIHVGKEVGRYANVISYFELEFDGNALLANKTSKSKYSSMRSIAYKDTYATGFFADGYPNRSKLQAFIYEYQNLSQLTAAQSSAEILVNGVNVSVSGYTVNNNNYYKIRDIAMILRTTSKKFNVEWDSEKNAINILPGVKYTIVGGELSDADENEALIIVLNNGTILKDGQPVDVSAYNINGNNYFKIRDIGELVGFTVGWDDASSTITIEA